MPQAPATPPRHVFVYGTLRRGGDNDMTRLAPAPRFVGAATIQGVMYHLGRYPGVTLGGARAVQGEVYEIEPALERVLDEIEELSPLPSSEYFKRIVPVQVMGRWLDCIVYEINPDHVHGRPVIAGGDWVPGR
ncbi:gamma-glutamylcyclotransferase family protein [Variovorax terrae]|uniref:Gamma-glutamylcyclotransferase n=1 Tax=Variovorax terrae TaxID=2923278 RepID=A0A9X2AR11_9BURK|nr:gamma-glutamylcyclotransferase family protein [Variovorax terrae]MCJ0763731.1 gamma-glutamylcyclotransferase [Variovorax terrae]